MSALIYRVGQHVTLDGRPGVIVTASTVRLHELTREAYQILTVADYAGRHLIGSRHSKLLRRAA